MPSKTLSAGISALALAVCAVGNTVAEEEEAGFTKQIEYRQSLMTVYKWNLGPMAAMVKGKIPYEQGTFERHATELAAAAQLDVLSGFPEDSISDDSDAKDEIWMQWEDFADKHKALQQQSAKLAEIAAAGNHEAIKKQFGDTAGACKACHKEYKQ